MDYTGWMPWEGTFDATDDSDHTFLLDIHGRRWMVPDNDVMVNIEDEFEPETFEIFIREGCACLPVEEED